ncbi:hypothetical protein [Curtobacterium sp. Leaf261]|uniref:hypothetical protein n=1 Tax=Curtobacterium sp. Leaf261 TaxID=1736311 RepID=UPI0006F92747|nr:hypothetical protein [Curtobacterium sp. Leaf261]KQO62380.1 hypothetical protein ASF23_11420 [Curtobacterium sp. Leaf261]
MHDTVTDAMLVVPQFASVCCVVGDRYRPRPGVVVPAAVMLVAMLLPAFDARPGTIVLAATVLLLVAPLPVMRRRRPDGLRAEPMDVHRALSAVVMAGMLLMSAATSAAATSTAASVNGGSAHDAMSHGVALGAVLGGGVIGYCAFSGWLLRYEWNRADRRTVRSAEVFAMTVAVVGMTLAM